MMAEVKGGEVEVRIVEAAVCPFCACLCDDIVVVVDKRHKKIKEVRNACKFGVNKFFSTELSTRIKQPRVAGKETSYDDAISKAADILKNAKKPLIYGLSNSGYDAQTVALKIAQKTKGVFDTTDSICHNLLYQQLKKMEYPYYYALLDEIKDKANVIVYWGSNPVESHLRHLSKFSVYPLGEYALKGVMDRELMAIDVVDSRIKKLSNWFLRVNVGEGEDAKIAQIIEKLVKGETKGLRELVAEGMDLNMLGKMADRLKKSFYGVIFFGLGILSSENAAANIRALFSLTDVLNKLSNGSGRFVMFPMKGHFNVMGAVQLLLRETGYPFGVDFSFQSQSGSGIFEPGETTVLDVIERGVDAALIVGADPFSSFPKEKAKKLRDIPLILIDPFENATTQFASVVFPTAITGVEAEGIAYRMDGLPLKMEKIIDCDYPTDKQILQQIYENESPTYE